ncbi:MAG: type II toxin-antitoxin system RelE/ParE family toxin [Desulfarculales bacterium]|jgi:addiction module RelE/StbE family toxin|nr:type II toxin-antitoxin system RelE/ParE family toxin [Desulfarculales bacterium]
MLKKTKFELRWRKKAGTDLELIIGYISRDNLDAAEALLSEIIEKTGKLTVNPSLYKKGRVAGTREMVVRKNYIVVYAIVNDVVWIVRILHAARDF